MPRIKEFLAEESGLSAVEYGLVLGIISMASVVAWDAMGNTLENVYGDLASDVEQSS
ncbi:MAG TPA: Flp family type IVb pilin [Kiloniellaceae bacterium]|nr:Flp family type IVb pilin [Kiloniellaceae bacterium]